MSKILRALSAVALGAAASGALALGVAHAAAASGGTPPWEPDPNSVGGLIFYNSAGEQITGGSVNSSPIAAYVKGTSVINSADSKATLFGYLPVNGELPAQWSGEALGRSTTYPNASAPGTLATTTLPVETGGSTDETVAQLAEDFPNNDTSSDGYAHMYQLRLKTSAPGIEVPAKYDSADIKISGSTWSVVYPAPTLTESVTSANTGQTVAAGAGVLTGLSPTNSDTFTVQVAGANPGDTVTAAVCNPDAANPSPLSTGFPQSSCNVAPLSNSATASSSGQATLTVPFTPGIQDTNSKTGAGGPPYAIPSTKDKCPSTSSQQAVGDFCSVMVLDTTTLQTSFVGMIFSPTLLMSGTVGKATFHGSTGTLDLDAHSGFGVSGLTGSTSHSSTTCQAYTGPLTVQKEVKGEETTIVKAAPWTSAEPLCGYTDVQNNPMAGDEVGQGELVVASIGGVFETGGTATGVAALGTAAANAGFHTATNGAYVAVPEGGGAAVTVSCSTINSVLEEVDGSDNPTTSTSLTISLEGVGDGTPALNPNFPAGTPDFAGASGSVVTIDAKVPPLPAKTHPNGACPASS